VPCGPQRKRDGVGSIAIESFAVWVRHLFDHPAEGPQWFAAPDAPYWAGTPDLTITWVTRLLEDPLPSLSKYSDAQLGQGFWYLVSNGGSDCMVALLDGAVPIRDRVRCVRAFTTVFRRIFALRCTPHLSHLDEAGCGALNGACYMWWDLLPVGAAPDDTSRRDLDRAALGVMTEALSLDAIACQESALHGLGHWHAAYPQEVERIVDRFLVTRARDRPELLAYARSARGGCVQ
jgi:hypothetical protein